MIIQFDELRKARKLHYRTNFQGIPISIENRKGSYRHWRDRKGETGKTLMRYAYGYVRGVGGADGDELDVFIGPDKTSDKVFVVNQRQARGDARKFDEHKCMLGWPDAKSAKAAYLAHFDDTKFFGSMAEMTVERFKRWISNGQDKKRPVRKSLIVKGGPYYGPKGGKYADPRHKIPWKDRDKAKPHKPAPTQAEHPSGRSPHAVLLANSVRQVVHATLVEHGNVTQARQRLKAAKPWPDEHARRKTELAELRDQVKHRQKPAEAKAMLRASQAVKTQADIAAFVSKYKYELDPGVMAVVTDKPRPESAYRAEAWDRAHTQLRAYTKLEDTSNRKPRTTDPDKIAKAHGLGAVMVNEELPPATRKYALGMVSNAFEDLRTALGVTKLEHGGLSVRVTAEEASYNPGYDYGARYIQGSLRKEQWDPKWNDQGWVSGSAAYDLQTAKDRHAEQRPPQIQLTLDTGNKMAHEFGHALDYASMHADSPEQGKVFAEAKRKVHEAIEATGMPARAKAHGDAPESRSHYWDTPTEMWARAMEQYVHTKLAAKGKVNSLLTEAHYDEHVHSGVFFSAEEFRGVSKAIDGMLKVAESTGMLRKAWGTPPLVTSRTRCPHPARRGRHEVYLRKGGWVCRACGATGS